MPTYGKFAPFCMSRNKSGLVGINRNNPCDGYFGCDDEEIFQDDEKGIFKMHITIKLIRQNIIYISQNVYSNQYVYCVYI